MRLINSTISEKDGAGSVTLRPEVPEDLWHAYNMIVEGDIVKATTMRKVVTQGATGSTSSSKVRTTLCLQVEDVDFDPATCMIRVRGKNVAENKFVKMGAYHTSSLELQANFTIEKPCWDAMYQERLELATNPAHEADVAAIVMGSQVAYVCLITAEMTITRAKIEVNVPKKRIGNSSRQKALNKYFELILQAILRHVDFEIVKTLIIASPGYIKEDLRNYLVSQATSRDIKEIRSNKDKMILCHASSGHKRALREVLSNPELLAKLSETKAVKEVQALQDFFELMNNDPDRAFYGYKHVLAASNHSAVDTLLVTDSLFRSADVLQRKQYVALVEAVKEAGGTVHVFSSLHVSGEQLAQISGVAAILRFPLPHVDELQEPFDDIDSDGDYDSEDTVYEDEVERTIAMQAAAAAEAAEADAAAAATAAGSNGSGAGSGAGAGAGAS